MAIYERFSSEEQRGLRKGGRAHVAASIIAGRSVGTRETQDRKNNRQEKDITQYAKRKGIWIGHKELQNKYGDPINSGKESVVYYDTQKGKVVKSTNTLQFRTLEEALDGITLHNTYFPKTALNVIGFGKNRDGEFEIISVQPYIKEEGRKLSQEEISEYLGKLGFEKHEDGLAHNYKNNIVLLRDMHPENVILTPEGNIAVIDTIMRINTSDLGFGGKREIKSSPIKFQLEDEKEENGKSGTTDSDGISYLHESSGDYGPRSNNVQWNRNTSDLFSNRRTIKSIKTMGYDFQKQQSPQEFLYRLTLHNALFPSTKYELEGFTKDISEYFRFVTRQKFIIGDIVPVEDRVKYMQEKLATVPVDEAKEIFKNTNYVIKDLHSKNLFGNNGILYLMIQ